MNPYDFSPLGENLEYMAFDLFRSWTSEVKRKRPGKNLVIRDESLLVSDLHGSLTSALDALIREGSGKGMDWQVHYFYGFLSSNLNYVWCNEYLHKQSNEYRMIVMLQSLQKYMIFHEQARYETGDIYFRDLEDHINIQDYEKEILATLEAVQLQLEIPFIRKIQNTMDHPVLTCLDNIITEKINDFAERETDRYFSDLSVFISDDSVRTCLALNNIPSGRGGYTSS